MKAHLYSPALRLLLLFAFFISAFYAQAETCTAVGNGNWGDNETWSCKRPPASGDLLVIPKGVKVTVTDKYSYTGFMYIKVFGILSFENNADKLTLGEDGIVEIEVGGKIIASLKNDNNSVKLAIGKKEIFESKNKELEGYQYCTKNGCNISVPQPIRLASFRTTYQAREQRVRLEWSTTSEINNDYFTIERSSDADNFEGIERVKGAGNSRTQVTYTAYDENPLPGLNYYRLRQTDFDGTSTFSKLEAVQNTGTSERFGFEAAPNPFNGQDLRLVLYGESPEPLAVSVFGSLGQPLYDCSQPLEGDHRLSLRLKQPLSSGLYWVKVSQAGQTATKAVLVQK
jgi:hypothetical protein